MSPDPLWTLVISGAPDRKGTYLFITNEQGMETHAVARFISEPAKRLFVEWAKRASGISYRDEREAGSDDDS